MQLRFHRLLLIARQVLDRAGRSAYHLRMTDAGLPDTETPIEQTEAANGGGRKYERSQIGFPYGNLKDAEEVANSLHAKWGDAAEVDQLAAGIGTTKASGAFRAKLGTARTFGVVEGRGRVRLTPLGKQLIDPQTTPAARAEAFLSVPLFKALYEKHKGSLLPPDEALENEIQELGVSSRQTDRARQSFQRSAEQAGFFALGRDRLIMPNVKNLPDVKSSGQSSAHSGSDAKIDRMQTTRSDLRPEVIDLLATLLKDGADWPPEKIVEFLGTARKLNELLAS
jgi:hypothetical protein